MNQKFIKYVQDVEKLYQRFPRVPWAEMLGDFFVTYHRDLADNDPETYAQVFKDARAEVLRRTGFDLPDARSPF